MITTKYDALKDHEVQALLVRLIHTNVTLRREKRRTHLPQTVTLSLEETNSKTT